MSGNGVPIWDTLQAACGNGQRNAPRKPAWMAGLDLRFAGCGRLPGTVSPSRAWNWPGWLLNQVMALISVQAGRGRQKGGRVVTKPIKGSAGSHALRTAIGALGLKIPISNPNIGSGVDLPAQNFLIETVKVGSSCAVDGADR